MTLGPINMDATFWVGVSFLIFVVLTAKPIGGFLAASLDKRRAKIETDLAEAARLRDEAQATLAEYQRRQREAHADAEELLASARQTVANMEREAAERLKTAVEARTQAAHDKIARHEHDLARQLQKRIVESAIAGAAVLFEGELNDETHERLISLAAKDASRLLH